MNIADARLHDVRDGPRRNMFLAAVLRRGSEQAPVKIRNMSALGALIDSPLVLAPNSHIELIRGNYVAHGRVVWTGARKFGIRFLSELSVNDWLAPVDAQPATVHAQSGVSSLPETVERDSAPTVVEVAVDDLLRIADLVERAARRFSSDPEVLRQHMTEGRNLVRAMTLLTRMCDPIR